MNRTSVSTSRQDIITHNVNQWQAAKEAAALAKLQREQERLDRENRRAAYRRIISRAGRQPGRTMEQLYVRDKLVAAGLTL